MSTNCSIRVRLFRFDPSVDEHPGYETFEVPRTPEMRVLDVLTYIYQELDQAIGIRWFCGTKKCGECAVMVNGMPVLSCWEAVTDEMTCEPIPNFPVLKDLVVDTEAYERRLVSLRPYMVRKVEPKFPERISHAKMQAAHELSKCIECNICTAAAPIGRMDAHGIDWSEDAGAAALVRFSRFAFDPRDEIERFDLATRAGFGRFAPHEILRKICPQRIDIVDAALVPLRERFFEGELPTCPQFETVFIMAKSWSGFVQLSANDKSKLQEDGKIVPMSIAGMQVGAYKWASN
jgi:succinate dehydrogenase/fumarate reductase iron-sulfur protein